MGRRIQNYSLTSQSWLDRRRFLSEAATGLGAIAVTQLLGNDRMLRGQEPLVDATKPFAPRPPHFAPKAKNVLVVFCAGAVSQLETWDFKPELIKQDGKPMPDGPAVTFQGPAGELARPQYRFRPRGDTGKMVSDMLPNLAEMTDQFAFVHSLTSETNTHGPAENFLSTGFAADGFPSIGSWVGYALGSENQNLPAFVAIPDPRGVPQASVNNWGAGFLPAEFQGTPFNAQNPIRHLAVPPSVSPGQDAAARDLLQKLNEIHHSAHPHDDALAARIASYELAARMQLSMPKITRLQDEPAYLLRRYGANDESNPIKAQFARNCLLARRLIENGVRFVQLFNGAYASGGELNWDGHNKLKEQYDRHAMILDQPVAALIDDLNARGLLDETLVVWCTEFGRMPMFQKGAKGRDHNPHGFTCWLTGAGVRTGVSHGATDDLGMHAVEDVHPLYDFNATILHLLGLNHEQLTFEHNGVQRRLTNVEGHVIHELLT